MHGYKYALVRVHSQLEKRNNIAFQLELTHDCNFDTCEGYQSQNVYFFF